LSFPFEFEEEEDFFKGDRERGEWDSSSLEGVLGFFCADLEKKFI
jgi:hypothetical protein